MFLHEYQGPLFRWRLLAELCHRPNMFELTPKLRIETRPHPRLPLSLDFRLPHSMAELARVVIQLSHTLVSGGVSRNGGAREDERGGWRSRALRIASRGHGFAIPR